MIESTRAISILIEQSCAMITYVLLLITDDRSHELYYRLGSHTIHVEIVCFEESLNLLRSTKTDVIIIDCGSDAERGIQILLDIKKISQNTPVIFLTDSASDDVGVRVFKTGAREFFRKPANLDNIRTLIERLLILKEQSIQKRTPLTAAAHAESEEQGKPFTPAVPAHILRCFRYIEDNLLHDCSLRALASQAHLSKYHFCRTFKKITGMSPMGYVRVQRIQRAKKLLWSRETSISMVAAEVGINNLSSFERQFKLITGETPSAYKKSLHST